jgi:hypothetical protein
VDEFNVQVGVVSFGSAGEFAFACHVIVLSELLESQNTIDFFHTIPGPDTVTDPEYPDGFARVSFFCDWIENAVCKEILNDEVFCSSQSKASKRSPKAKASKQPSQAKASKQPSQAKASKKSEPKLKNVGENAFDGAFEGMSMSIGNMGSFSM